MSKCVDCLSQNVCEEINNLKCRKDFIWYSAEYGCPHFKDKSLFVELPCKVGDEVYCIWQYADFMGKKDKPFIQRDVVTGWICLKGKTKLITRDYSEMDDNWYKLLDVGLTKEEAERKLREVGE